ncbi:MAG: glycogen synthase [Chlamydiia bacterium]|nr:glycogen synthase [Chlamydiia bacterium]
MGMEIVHIASEFAPFAKAGGLGDVIQGLTRAQILNGHRVSVILPAYGGIHREPISHLALFLPALTANTRQHQVVGRVWKGDVNGVALYLIEPFEPEPYFAGKELYGDLNDPERFLAFNLLAAGLLPLLPQRPTILHVHDWPTAMALRFAELTLSPLPGTVLTIHNLAYQGWVPRERAEPFMPSKVELSCEGDANLLREGILQANWLTTVSPTYAKQVLEPEWGMGLEGILRKKHFVGILNGIDEQTWNPETDPLLPHHFGHKTVFSQKQLLKTLLRKELALSPSKKPMICTITRLTEQKGLDLIEHMIHRTIEGRWQFVLLGISLDPAVQSHFQALKERYAHNRDLYLHMRHDEELSHHVYAASDCIFIPSIFEPCGLTQMIGMRYGTLPIARKTGGLGDSITDCSSEDGNGFLFCDPDTRAVDWAVERAVEVWNNAPKTWERVVHNAMRTKLGWSDSAKRYEEVYAKTLVK